MITDKPKGLKGLRGVGDLSSDEYNDFIEKNKALIAAHNNDPTYINQLYKNKQFIDTFGLDRFKSMPDYRARNAAYEEVIINTEWDKKYSPFKDGIRDNTQGLGTTWDKYNMMSTSAKRKLLESDWLTPKEFAEKIAAEDKRTDETYNDLANSSTILSANQQAGRYLAIGLHRAGMDGTETAHKFESDKNDLILERIYNEDVDNKKNLLAPQVSEMYRNYAIANLSDEQVKKAFIKAIMPGNYVSTDDYNMGIPEYASHYGNGSEDEISSEMKNFSINDMREVLAKKAVYDKYMDKEAAATALNNEAKRYIKDHQSNAKRLGLFLKDVGISSLSYTADKVNGFYNLGLLAADTIGNKPVVLVDDSGNILANNDARINTDPEGNMFYIGDDGKRHFIHREQVARAALHKMGKNSDGSNNTSLLNPQYWTRAEQFGTLDEDEQKQYEKLGSSPYKVAYDPGEDSNLWYEAFKMTSFAIADASSQLIPFGIGAAGRILSTASKAGKAATTLGKAMDFTGKALTAQTKFGQIAQGTAGAVGIAYAYDRGAYQETLAQNLEKADEANMQASQNDVYQKYHGDKEYKAAVDAQVATRETELVNDFVANSDTKEDFNLDDVKYQAHKQAQYEMLQGLINNRFQERKSSKEYANLQQEAINSANITANSVFIPEAIKYGLINTMGFRKYLYTNPAGLTKKVSSSLKGIEEAVNSEGKKRLITQPSKFLTRKQKIGQLSKIVGKQSWGGAWTNGTDDMMVDGSERINSDKFSHYTDAYVKGEAIADTWGFADGLYSYMRGLSNSLGQNTTWNATAVGALGSIVSFGPNFTNIAHLTTKEGRDMFKSQYLRKEVLDSNGNVEYNVDGTPKTESTKWYKNGLERANFFIQNGVLNNYYGKKQHERELAAHARYVNNILDEYDDFQSIEDLIASNIGMQDAENIRDQKTQKYLTALRAMNTLSKLANNNSDPATMSSVIQNAKTFIDKASKMSFGNDKDSFSEEEVNNMLSSYYANNPGIAQSDANSQKALYEISQNAQELIKASEDYDKAEQQVQKVEKSLGRRLDSRVREIMKEQQALDGHWRDRIRTMQNEIDDASSPDRKLTSEERIATLGSIKNAEQLQHLYDVQLEEVGKELEEQIDKTDDAIDALEKAQKEARTKTKDSEKYQAQTVVQETQAKYDAAIQQENYLKEIIALTKSKQKEISDALKEVKGEDFHEPGTITTGEDKTNSDKTKVLTADEIFALDPVSRARMLDSNNRNLYSDEQKKEIEKLEKKLLMRDGNALSKIQDIANLTERVAQNEDAYSRLARFPEAAAYQLETERAQSADMAYDLINHRNAELVTNFINEFLEGVKGHGDVTTNDYEQFVTRALRQLNPTLLDIIEKNQMLPAYQKQVAEAKEWVGITNNIDAAIDAADKSDVWKDNIRQNIANIIESASTKTEIMHNLEQVINDNGVQSDFDYILNGLTKMGYQRDATVIEIREDKKKREAEERKKREEEAKKREEAKQKSIEEANEQATKAQVDAELEEQANNTVGTVDANTVPVTGLAKPGSEAPEGVEGHEFTPEEKANTKLSEEYVDWSKMPSLYMDEGAEDGTMSLGDVYYGATKNPHHSPFTVTKKGDEITFSTEEGNRSTSLTLNKDDWQYDTPQLVDGAVAGSKVDRSLGVVEGDDVDTAVKKTDSSGNIPFRATRIFKERDGNWYAEGTFRTKTEGIVSPTNAIVKLKKNFDLDTAINRHIESTNAMYEAKGVDTGNPHLIDDGDTVAASSGDIDVQVNEIGNTAKKDIDVSDNTEDSAVTNAIVETNGENHPAILSGNAMVEYEVTPLREQGKLVKRKGTKEGDSLNAYNAWMDAQGIKLQKIIDEELGQILKLNPQAKVKFMATRPQANATHDGDVKSHLFLVLDYDNSINKSITDIHNDDNGGVIESNGKKYLIIGTVGYGNRASAQNNGKWALWNTLFSNNPNVRPNDSPIGYGLVKRGMGKFFNEHPGDRFYVPSDINTEVVPQSLVPGYVVRQLETDEAPQFRSIKDILKDPARNPLGLDMENLTWGIQKYRKFALIGAKVGHVMVPRNPYENTGRAFALIPASNGKLVPAYLKPLFYTEMNDGSLKGRIDTLVQQLMSPNYHDRLAATIELSKILLLDKNDNTILLRKNTNEISLVKDGTILKTFVLDSSLDRQTFMESFKEMNPRINVTPNVLGNKDLLEQYDEAGALTTDLAQLATAGSFYSIYGVNADGKVIKPESPSNDIPKTSSNSDYKRTGRTQIPFENIYYTEQNGVFYKENSDAPITDESVIKQLQYNKRIQDKGAEPFKTDGLWRYYIMNADNAEVVRVNNNTHKVEVLPEKQAKDLIKQKKEEEKMKETEKNALDAIKGKDNSLEVKELEDVDMGDVVDQALVVDPTTGELVTPSNTEETTDTSTVQPEKETPSTQDIGTTSISDLRKIPSDTATKTFDEIIKNRDVSTQVIKLMRSKWANAPSKISDLKEFLRQKDIDVESIGTSKEAIDSWIYTIENCRK